MKRDLGIFVSVTNDPVDLAVSVGKSNEHVEFVNDMINESTFVNLDPLTQLQLLEEMDEIEAIQLVTDIYRIY